MENSQQTEDTQALEGSVTVLADDAMRCKAIDTAFDYRGDVTLETQDGESYEGYLFNRDATCDQPFAMMMLKDGGEKKILYTEMTQITFSDKNPAAGKTWEAWLKRYAEKKLKGEAANIESESLED